MGAAGVSVGGGLAGAGAAIGGAVAAASAGSGPIGAQVAGRAAPSVTAGSPGSAASGRAGYGAPTPAGAPGIAGIAGIAGSPGRAGAAGTMPGAGGAGSPAPVAGSTGVGTAGSAAAGDGETGRLVGITAAHNVVRMRQNNPVPMPPLPPLTWSNEVAKIAQAYAEKLAASGCNLVHSTGSGLGENLAYYGGIMATASQVVEGWAGEESCYKFGVFMRDDSCDMTCTTMQNSNGCGHYTQVVWRNTTQVGCGVATCGTGRSAQEVWVCNYKAPGNYVGQRPY